MRAFTHHRGVAVPLDRSDVDTDQIIPKQFLKRTERTGYGTFLFHGWRQAPGASPEAAFVLDDPAYAAGSVLLAGANFGCGSSREHAAWALADHGFRAIIAPSFADIFRANADQNGLVTVELEEEEVRQLMSRASHGDGYQVNVDLNARTVSDDDGFLRSFEIDDFRRECLMRGLDRISLTLCHEDAIAAYERTEART